METTRRDQGLCASLFPTGYLYELKELLCLAWPIIITQILQYFLQPLAVIFCGRLGKAELDAVALANSLINVTGISIAAGLATACDTLFSQTYGSKNKHKLGVCLQRSMLVILLGIFPCWAIHLNAEQLLLLIGQDPEVSRLTARYLLIFMPGLLGFFLYEPLAKYIQNQNIVMPNMAIALVPNIITAVLHYVLVIEYGLGTDGSAIAQVVSYLSFFPLTLIYIYFSKIYKDTWNGWTMECLEHWGQFFSLSIAGLLLMAIEWWSFEIGTFLAGLIGTTELGAQSVIMSIESVTYMFPLGIGISASIRVGQYLGAGSAVGAKSAYRTAVTVIWVVSLTIGVVLASLAKYLPMIFTNVQEVIDLAGTILPIVGLYMVFDGTCGVTAGVLRGSGRQHLGVGVVLIGYCFIGLPVGISLMFLTSLRLSGLWWALAGALFVDAIIYSVILYFTNWEKQAELASERVTKVTKSERKITDEKTSLLGRQFSSSSDASIRRKSVPLPQRKASVSFPDPLFDHGSSGEGEEPTSNLSRSQLICRRLAILVLMLFVLVVGILCRIYIPVSRAVENLNNSTTTAATFEVMTTTNESLHLTTADHDQASISP